MVDGGVRHCARLGCGPDSHLMPSSRRLDYLFWLLIAMKALNRSQGQHNYQAQDRCLPALNDRPRVIVGVALHRIHPNAEQIGT